MQIEHLGEDVLVDLSGALLIDLRQNLIRILHTVSNRLTKLSSLAHSVVQGEVTEAW